MVENGAVSLKVDGRVVQVPAGTLAVEAAREAGVEIPVFCYHPRLDPVGTCRMCLVEIGTPLRRADGTVETDESGAPAIRMMPKLQTACTTTVSEGMVLVTDSPAAAEAQRGVLELLLTSHPLDCPVCDKGGECPLQELTYSYGPGKSRFCYGEKFHFQKPVPFGPLIYLDRERCILCARCTRFQEEIAGHPVLAMASRGRGMEIVTYSDPPFDSKFSGNTVDICPVGALTSADFRFRARPWELENRPAVCPHCPVGCNLILGTRTGTARRVVPRVNEAVNEEWICDKGRFAHHYLRSERRLTAPLVRRNGSLEPASWEEALGAAAAGLRKIRDEAGPAALAGIGSVRTSNEANYLFQKLLRAVLGTNHIDHRIEGGWRHEELPGLWRWQVPHGAIAAVEQAGMILVVGGDLSEAQPVLEVRVKKARRQGSQLVVVNPRSTELAKMADVWIPHRPGGEVGVLGGILRRLVDGGKTPVEPSPELLRSLRYFSARRVARSVGADPEAVAVAARAFEGSGGLAVLVDEGALQAGCLSPLIDVVALTGNANHLGTVVFPLRRGSNPQGARDMGVFPDLLPGYMPLPGAGADRYAEAWDAELPSQPGLGTRGILSGTAAGEIQGLYIMGADVLSHFPEYRLARSAIEAASLVIAQDLFLTETVQQADVVFPAAPFAETDGSFTNLEGRIQSSPPALEPWADSRSDAEILAGVAEALGASLGSVEPAAVRAEIAKLVPGYSSVAGRLPDEGQLWTERQTREWLMTPVRWPREAVVTADGYALISDPLLFDAGTMVAESELLTSLMAEPVVVVHPQDAESIGILDGDRVAIEGPDGSPRLAARISLEVPVGAIHIPRNLPGLPLNRMTDGADGAARVRLRRAAR